MNPVSVLFVCSSNICRSPLAEAVLRARAAAAGMPDIVVDSAGLYGGHLGEPPDARACAAAARRGYAMPKRRARRIEARDFERFASIFAMDENNLAALRALAPQDYPGRIGLFLDVVPECGVREIDDPYFGALAGFERVLDLCEAASDALLRTLAARG